VTPQVALSKSAKRGSALLVPETGGGVTDPDADMAAAEVRRPSGRAAAAVDAAAIEEAAVAGE
jgi:hypothetical protein